MKFRLPAIFKGSSSQQVQKIPEAIQPPETLELPSRKPSQRSGIFIDPGQVLALGFKKPNPPSLLYKGEPPELCELTVLLKNADEIKTWAPPTDVQEFAQKIYDAIPDAFVFAVPDSDFLTVDKRASYIIAKGQVVTGKTVYDDGFSPWGIDLSLSEAGSIRIYTAGYRSHKNNSAYQKFADDLAVVSQSVQIKHAMYGVYTGKPSRKEPPEQHGPFKEEKKALPTKPLAPDDQSDKELRI